MIRLPPRHGRRERTIDDRTSALARHKKRLRRRGRVACDLEPHKDTASRAICETVAQMPTHAAAATIMWYVNRDSEVRTRHQIEADIARGARVVIPYCDGAELGLWRLEQLDELEPGTWGIPEPPAARWREPGRQVAAGDIDLAVVPGVAFDTTGGRLGHGKGFYDRLMRKLRSNARCIGVCFESQIQREIPMGPEDVYVDRVVTQLAVYRGRGRGRRW